MITKGIITSESRPIVWNLNQNEIEPIWIIKPYMNINIYYAKSI